MKERHDHGPFDEILSAGGASLGRQCRSCNHVFARCRVCKKVYAQIGKHLARSECGTFDAKGMFWAPERPPTAEQYARGLKP